jgi:GNAT superfamily N-acetyltransferase
MTTPDLEGRGIGGRLLAAIEDATRVDVDTFELSTGAKSANNIAMYGRRGYRVVGEQHDGHGHSIVTMRKPARAD